MHVFMQGLNIWGFYSIISQFLMFECIRVFKSMSLRT